MGSKKSYNALMVSFQIGSEAHRERIVIKRRASTSLVDLTVVVSIELYNPMKANNPTGLATTIDAVFQKICI